MVTALAAWDWWSPSAFAGYSAWLPCRLWCTSGCWSGRGGGQTASRRLAKVQSQCFCLSLEKLWLHRTLSRGYSNNKSNFLTNAPIGSAWTLFWCTRCKVYAVPPLNPATLRSESRHEDVVDLEQGETQCGLVQAGYGATKEAWVSAPIIRWSGTKMSANF